MSYGNKILLFIFGVFVLIFFSISLYCKDHSRTLKKIGISMEENVMSFYKKHQRYPDLKESTELMEKTACKNNVLIEQKENKNKNGKIYEREGYYYCKHWFKKIRYAIIVADPRIYSEADPYDFGFNYGKTHCFSSDFEKNGTLINKFNCTQESCFLKNWSH